MSRPRNSLIFLALCMSLNAKFHCSVFWKIDTCCDASCLFSLQFIKILRKLSPVGINTLVGAGAVFYQVLPKYTFNCQPWGYCAAKLVKKKKEVTF